ncbi:MAG TPA: anti-sigma factor [Candidatus Binataceae bacterium]|nr:anti-sigma factor [Candidatus Binataceae bacterium]
MDHEQLINLLPLAALDREEPDEARLLEEHLREGCPQCEAELRAWRETLAAYAMASEPAGSENRVWQRLDARLHAEAAAAHSLARTVLRPRRPDRGERQPSVGWWRGVAAIAAAAAVLLLVYDRVITNRARRAEVRQLEQLETLSWQLNDLRADLSAAQTQAETLSKVLDERARLDRVLMAPDLQLTRLAPTGPARSAGGVVAVSHASHAAVVQAFGLPPAPPGKTYELWWITKEGGPRKAGLFHAQTGRTAVAPASMPPPGERVMLAAVTLEPAGGVDKPTGNMYLKGAVERE